MKNILIIGLLFLFFDCSWGDQPKGILSEKEVTSVLVDLHLAESLFTSRYNMQINRENYLEDLYLSVLKKHKIDKNTLEKSILYYGRHPEKYKAIYDDVLDRLNEMSVKNRIRDSLAVRNNVNLPPK